MALQEAMSSACMARALSQKSLKSASGESSPFCAASFQRPRMISTAQERLTAVGLAWAISKRAFSGKASQSALPFAS